MSSGPVGGIGTPPVGEGVDPLREKPPCRTKLTMTQAKAPQNTTIISTIIIQPHGPGLLCHPLFQFIATFLPVACGQSSTVTMLPQVTVH